METRVQQVDVPSRALELAGLDRVDYADAFTVAVPDRRTPEEWMRTAVQGNPALFGAVRVAHRALGLRLAPAESPDHLIGWDILRSEPDEAMLGNGGALGAARIVGLAPPGRIVLATVLKLNGAVGRALWTAAAPAHREVARRALSSLTAAATERAHR